MAGERDIEDRVGLREVPLWKAVLEGNDFEQTDPLGLEGLLVEVTDAQARYIFHTFDCADELFTRWRNVVDNYTAVPEFDEDRITEVLTPYLAQIKSLASANGLEELADVATLDRVEFHPDGDERDGDLTEDWLELLEQIITTEAPELHDQQVLEIRSVEAALLGVAYLPELNYYLMQPLQPSSTFNPDLFYALWANNADVVIDTDAIHISRRVNPHPLS